MQEAELDQQNRNPAVERMVAILDELEKVQTGLGLKDLSERTGVTRSSVYRILNSLCAHGIVRQLDNTDYVLGSRLLALADAVVPPTSGRLARLAQPILDSAARSLGETAKLSVYDRGRVLVIAVAPGSQPHALHAQVGEVLPIHAGGGSKALMAHLPAEERQRIYSRPLLRFNDSTLIDEAGLEAELEIVRNRGWSHDGGEFSATTNAYAAPILGRNGEVLAALSIPFYAGRTDAYERQVLDTVTQTANRIANELTRQDR